ncbi:MAG: type II toxin-antitoxin system VapC family toxin [Acidobacteriia bacterium]|nr:type II toxin-antitoxin system VapC family toxin [Terriglobia bacterium]
MTVADTDVLIDFLAGAEPTAGRVGQELEHGDLHTTVITRFELLAGARSKRQKAAVRDLLAALPALTLDEAAADRAAGVRIALESKGGPIGMADSLIAGIVLQNGGMLLTRNVRHFQRIEGLMLVPFPA